MHKCLKFQRKENAAMQCSLAQMQQPYSQLAGDTMQTQPAYKILTVLGPRKANRDHCRAFFSSAASILLFFLRM